MEVLVAGELYHRTDPDCSVMNDPSTQHSGTVDMRVPQSQAEEQGHDPCPDCFPNEARA